MAASNNPAYEMKLFYLHVYAAYMYIGYAAAAAKGIFKFMRAVLPLRYLHVYS